MAVTYSYDSRSGFRKTEAMIEVEKKIGEDLGRYLFSRYVQNNNSPEQISKDLSIHGTTIVHWLDKYQIPKRTKAESDHIAKERDKSNFLRNIEARIGENLHSYLQREYVEKERSANSIAKELGIGGHGNITNLIYSVSIEPRKQEQIDWKSQTDEQLLEFCGRHCNGFNKHQIFDVYPGLLKALKKRGLDDKFLANHRWSREEILKQTSEAAVNDFLERQKLYPWLIGDGISTFLGFYDTTLEILYHPKENKRGTYHNFYASLRHMSKKKDKKPVEFLFSLLDNKHKAKLEQALSIQLDGVKLIRSYVGYVSRPFRGEEEFKNAEKKLKSLPSNLNSSLQTIFLELLEKYHSHSAGKVNLATFMHDENPNFYEAMRANARSKNTSLTNYLSNLVNSLENDELRANILKALKPVGGRHNTRNGSDKINTPEQLKNLFENEEVMRIVASRFDPEDAADVMAVMHSDRITREMLMELMDDPSLRAYLGTIKNPITDINGAIEVGTHLLPLDKGGMIHDLLFRTMQELRRKELGANPTQEKREGYLKGLERELNGLEAVSHV